MKPQGSSPYKPQNWQDYQKVHLLEEPQAVCYDWYARHKDTAAQELAQVPLILVCDVGGGTTDLSLIEAKHDNDELTLNRIGVGEHLMLGGDNLIWLLHIWLSSALTRLKSLTRLVLPS